MGFIRKCFIPLWMAVSLMASCAPAAYQTEKSQGEIVELKYVVDGDTIKVSMNGVAESVRLIGIDTPETFPSDKMMRDIIERGGDAGEEFIEGKLASNRLKELLKGRQISLDCPASMPERDKYNRLLCYVAADGKDVGLILLQEGFARPSGWPHPKLKEYKEAAE
jgi:micrococcal nuclease